MMNPKVIGIAAGAGFVLSFLIGIIAHVHIGVILLRAVIFAAVFAGIAAGIEYVAVKFLEETAGQPEVSETVTPQKKGTTADVVLDEDKLSDNSQEPQFFVSGNHPVFGQNESDKAAAGKVAPAAPNPVSVKAATASADDSFKPVNLAEGSQAAAKNPDVGEWKTEPAPAEQSVPEPENADSVQKEPEDQDSTGEADYEDALEDLPDIGDIVSDAGSGESDDIIDDSDFAASSDGKSAPQISKSDGTMNGKDATVMAQAIRTLIAKDGA